jgi:hypothetical protein
MYFAIRWRLNDNDKHSTKRRKTLLGQNKKEKNLKLRCTLEV